MLGFGFLPRARHNRRGRSEHQRRAVDGYLGDPIMERPLAPMFEMWPNDPRMFRVRRIMNERRVPDHRFLQQSPIPDIFGDGDRPRRAVEENFPRARFDGEQRRSRGLSPMQRSGGEEIMRENISFGKGLKKLFRQILQAEKLYGNFRSEYDSDISGVTKYANEDILNKLWISKVKGKKNPGDYEGSHGQAVEDAFLASPAEKFDAMSDKVSDALSGALDSFREETPQSRKQIPRVEAARRMAQKVGTASEQILDLLESAARGREYCSALLSELGLLKTLIDPNTEQNKLLYTRGGEDDDLTHVDGHQNRGAGPEQESEQYGLEAW